jgi:hypothetical protein
VRAETARRQRLQQQTGRGWTQNGMTAVDPQQTAGKQQSRCARQRKDEETIEEQLVMRLCPLWL